MTMNRITNIQENNEFDSNYDGTQANHMAEEHKKTCLQQLRRNMEWKKLKWNTIVDKGQELDGMT